MHKEGNLLVTWNNNEEKSNAYLAKVTASAVYQNDAFEA